MRKNEFARLLSGTVLALIVTAPIYAAAATDQTEPSRSRQLWRPPQPRQTASGPGHGRRASGGGQMTLDCRQAARRHHVRTVRQAHRPRARARSDGSLLCRAQLCPAVDRRRPARCARQIGDRAVGKRRRRRARPGRLSGPGLRRRHPRRGAGRRRHHAQLFGAHFCPPSRDRPHRAGPGADGSRLRRSRAGAGRYPAQNRRGRRCRRRARKLQSAASRVPGAEGEARRIARGSARPRVSAPLARPRALRKRPPSILPSRARRSTACSPIWSAGAGCRAISARPM